MDELWARFAEGMIDRVSGPLRLRLVLQPAVAAILAIVAGLKDARTGKPAYFWALLSQPAHRAEMLEDGWQSVGKVFVLALALDLVYQIVVLRAVHPVEAVVVAFLLAIAPYLILRGLVTRVAKTAMRRSGRFPSKRSRDDERATDNGRR